MLNWLFASSSAVDRDELDIDQMDIMLTRQVSAILARAAVPTFQKTIPRLRAELERARRYGRPLTLALLGDARTLEARTPGAATTPLGPGSPLIPVVLAPVLAEITRNIDIVTYASTIEQCVVAMPEVSELQACEAVTRLADLCTKRLHVPVRARLATFPVDGLTLEELIKKANSSGVVGSAAKPASLTMVERAS